MVLKDEKLQEGIIIRVSKKIAEHRFASLSHEMCDFFWINCSELTGTVTGRNDAGHGLLEHPPTVVR